MFKKLLITLCLLPAICNSQEVISSTGDFFSSSDGSVAFTVGEIGIETIATGTNQITQGFHQTSLSPTASIDDKYSNLVVNLFPNPTENNAILDIADFYGLNYKVYDLKGQLLQQKQIESKKTEVNLSSFSTGLYLVALYSNENKKINTYKIIKN